MARLSKDFYKMYSLLKDWYGKERAKVEINAYTPKAVAAGDVAHKLLKKTLCPDLLKSIKLRENWADIVGAQIAEIASPVSLKEKVLYVEVKHSVWLRELSVGATKAMLIKKINERYKEINCRDIQFVPEGR